MRTETTRLFKDLLSLHGHVADPGPGAGLAPDAASTTPGTSPEESTMNLFKSLWLLGGLQSIDPRIDDDDAPAFGPTYGNRIASERAFGSRHDRDAPIAPAANNMQNARNAPIVANDQRVAHC